MQLLKQCTSRQLSNTEITRIRLTFTVCAISTLSDGIRSAFRYTYRHKLQQPTVELLTSSFVVGCTRRSLAAFLLDATCSLSLQAEEVGGMKRGTSQFHLPSIADRCALRIIQWDNSLFYWSEARDASSSPPCIFLSSPGALSLVMLCGSANPRSCRQWLRYRTIN